MMETISKSAFISKERIIKKPVIRNESYIVTIADGREFILREDPETIKNMAAPGDAVAAIRVVGVCEDHVLEPVQDGGLDARAELAEHRHEDGHEQSEGEGVRPVPQPPLPASLSLGEDGEGGDGRYARHGAVLLHISREGLQAVDRVEGQRLVHKPPLCVVFE